MRIEGHLGSPQGMVQGNAVSDGTALLIRGNHDHRMPEGKTLVQRAQSGGKNTIVIG